MKDKLIGVSVVVLVLLALITIARPHIHRYHAEMRCMIGDPSCANKPNTGNNGTEINQYSTFSACEAEADKYLTQDTLKYVDHCTVHYTLEWGYTD